MAEHPAPAGYWQRRLEGQLLELRPLAEEDFEALFKVASDPLIWEQHPEKERYRREKFEVFFRSGIDSKGAYAIYDRKTGEVIGSSRFNDYHPATASIEIGYTFLARRCWGGGYNRELKALMLDHAFNAVETVYFVVGRWNTRSRLALAKVGAEEIVDSNAKASAPVARDWEKSALYQIKKSSRRL